MKTLVIANQKGGVGKTSTLVHLAFDFLERGLNVAVIDLDTQGNASFTLREYQSGKSASKLFTAGSRQEVKRQERIGEEPEIILIESDSGLANMEKLALAETSSHFRAALDELESQGFDVCLIDTAPSLGIAMASALLGADYVLSPIELEAYSIQGIKKMIMVIANIRKANNKLQFLGMVPSKIDTRNPRHRKHLDELEAAYPKLIIPAGIGLRSSIADALASGIPVWQIRKTAARKATKEMRALTQHVFSQMEIA